MQILPSASNREFTTGAVRGDDTGKGLPSLLPWEALRLVSTCFPGGWVGLPWKAVIEVAKVYEAGARKYAPRNWEAGIPISCFLDSATRHFAKFAERQTDEPHAGQFCWNLLCMLQTHLWVASETLPRDLLDLPVYGQHYPPELLIPRRFVGKCNFATIDEEAHDAMDYLAEYVLGEPVELVYACASALATLERHVETTPRRWLRESLNTAATDAAMAEFNP